MIEKVLQIGYLLIRRLIKVTNESFVQRVGVFLSVERAIIISITSHHIGHGVVEKKRRSLRLRTGRINIEKPCLKVSLIVFVSTMSNSVGRSESSFS